MTIRIGANPIGWSNDDLQEIGGDTPLETCLAEAREAGFEGMELGHKFPREPAALKAALAPFGLACVGGWYSAELLQARRRTRSSSSPRPHLDLLKAMGTDVFIVAETSNAIHGDRTKPLSQRPHLPAGDWADYGAGSPSSPTCSPPRALQALLSPPHGHDRAVARPTSTPSWPTPSPPVHLLLDTGHATWGGADPAALARRYRTRISHVHAKDVREDRCEARRAPATGASSIRSSGMGDELGVYTVPGDGMVDYAGVFRELHGYSGWVVVEAEQDPQEGARRWPTPRRASPI